MLGLDANLASLGSSVAESLGNAQDSGGGLLEGS